MLPSNSLGSENPLDSEEKISKEPNAHKKGWKKKVIYLLLFTLLLYPLSLLLINTPWVKSKITSKLAQKTGLDWQVGSITWVPFGDVYVNDLETVAVNEDKTGGISLELISVSPLWGRVITGDLVWDEIRLDGLELDVERAWLEEMIKKSSSANLPQLREEPKVAPPLKVEPIKPGEKDPPIAKHPKPTAPTKIKPKKETIADEPEVPEQTLIVTGLNIKVRDEDSILFQSNSIALDIPFAGKSRNGSISMTSDTGDLEKIPVIWNEKNVLIDKGGIEILGIKIDLKTRINTFSKSPMFAYSINIIDQPYHYELHKPNVHVKLHAERIEGQFIMSGNLLSPQTWNGLGGIQFSKFSIQETQKTMAKLEFDEVYARGRMMQGSILVDDATARGDSLTFMANGVVSKNTYSFGVLRCIANEEYCKKLTGIYLGSRAIKIDTGTGPLFVDLQTPDRKILDLYFDGKLNNMEFKHKGNKQWQSLNQFFKALKKFKDDELKEDGIYQLENEPTKMKKSTPANLK